MKIKSVMKIEKFIKKFMAIDYILLSKFGHENKHLYRNELHKELKKLKIKKLPDYYYLIFEDANYHSLNEALVKLNIFKTITPWTSRKAEIMYQQYLAQGGHTWNI